MTAGLVSEMWDEVLRPRKLSNTVIKTVSNWLICPRVDAEKLQVEINLKYFKTLMVLQEVEHLKHLMDDRLPSSSAKLIKVD